MDMPATGLALWLSRPERVAGLKGISALWREHEVRVVLAPVAPLRPGFGGHLRRSFLGGLAPGASDAARAGHPCNWEPPCALDVFLREQLRSGGDGLPKPYVLFWRQEGPAVEVVLRIFGTACDWAPAAAEGLSAGLTGILPWSKVVPGQGLPRILSRVQTAPGGPEPVSEGLLTLHLVTPMDDEGTRPDDTRDVAARLLSRAIRRVDAVARWQGAALDDKALRTLTAQAHAVQAVATRLRPAQNISPNSKGEMRRSNVLTGEIDLPLLPADLRLLLSLASRCHVGRHTNEGLGMIVAESPPD